MHFFHCSILTFKFTLKKINKHYRNDQITKFPKICNCFGSKKMPIEFSYVKIWQYLPRFNTLSQSNSLEDVNHPIPLVSRLRHEEMRVMLAAKILRLLCRAGQGRFLVATVPKAEPTSRTSCWGDVLFTSTGISWFKIICRSQIAKYPPLLAM